MTVTLELEVDTYLFPREGNARSGAFLYHNDDVEPGANLSFRISQTLAAGEYTIEAATYDAGQTGSCTLTVAGL